MFLLLFSAYCFSQKTSKKQELNPIDFSKSIHSLGVSLYSGFSFAPKGEYNGPIIPKIYNSYTPELTLQYSCIIKNNFGFTLEIPLGIFKRTSFYDLKKYNTNDVSVEVGSPYIGFSPKIAYLKELNRNFFMQAEFGLKFMPFYYSSEHWNSQTYINNSNSEINYLFVPQKNYYIPDVTASIFFLIHGKNQRSNFVVGITGNLSFVERMHIEYDTYESEIAPEYISFGEYGWTSSSIGLTLAYRFIGLKP